jgi:hypothetical protein
VVDWSRKVGTYARRDPVWDSRARVYDLRKRALGSE